MLRLDLFARSAYPMPDPVWNWVLIVRAILSVHRRVFVKVSQNAMPSQQVLIKHVGHV